MKKIKMKKRFGLIGTLMVAIFALTGVAHADGHLKFPIGEGEFSWDSYYAFGCGSFKTTCYSIISVS